MRNDRKFDVKTVLTSLGSLSNKAAYLQRLNLAVKALLPVEQAANCHVANVRDNILILHLDSAEWATALHYQNTDLLAQLRQQPSYAGLKSIQYKIRPLGGQTKKTSIEPAKPLSLKTQKLLADTAKSMKNKELAEALAKLSKH